MELFRYPKKEDWERIIRRPYHDQQPVIERTASILAAVKNEGDTAIRRLTLDIEGIDLPAVELDKNDWEQAAAKLPAALKRSIEIAADNIRTFHAAQLVQEPVVETMPDIRCWRKSVAIERAGLYIPGGTAPLFSTVLMLAIPASLAGVKEIILCTPASKDGSIHPAIVFAAKLAGVHRIFRIGGAQAIGAMAYGTATVPKVNKIFGPGNQYVTAAKQLVQMEGLAIDMPAGPSEVLIIADRYANAAYIAADMLSQAEHGRDSQALLLTDEAQVIKDTMDELGEQVKLLARQDIARVSLENSKAVLVRDLDEAMEISNLYAPEHLIICCRDAAKMAEKVINAGSVFLGDHTPETAGDYASGTNHTLPTNGAAAAFSGLSTESFMKKITFQEISRKGLEHIAPTIITMAEAEGLDAHANAVRVRMKKH